MDCQEPAFHKRRWYEALCFIVHNICSAYNISSDIKLHEPLEYDDKNASMCFEDDLKQLNKHFENKRILFILDEIENITFDISPTEHWARGMDFIYFWQSLRSIFQKNATLFSIIIAGVNPKAIETARIQEFDNPIYRLISPHYLDFFNVTSVREMVSSIGKYMGIEFEEEIYTHLTEEYGGHPFLIRQACSKIHQILPKQRPIKVTKYRFIAEKDRINTNIKDYIDLILEVLKKWYPLEYELIEALANGDYNTFHEFAQASSLFIEHLVGYGLIVKDNDKYYFRIKVVEYYLLEKTSQNKLLSRKEDKWREITSRRNELELELRKIVKVVLKSRFGSIKAKELFLDIVYPSKRREKLGNINFESIFDNEIYFDDLRKVIEKNWTEFENIFKRDKSKFGLYMEIINKHRVDAHAKEIDEDSYALLNVSFNWIKQCVELFWS